MNVRLFIECLGWLAVTVLLAALALFFGGGLVYQILTMFGAHGAAKAVSVVAQFSGWIALWVGLAVVLAVGFHDLVFWCRNNLLNANDRRMLWQRIRREWALIARGM